MAVQIDIEVGGRRYPFRQTMGAALLFKRVTGREMSVLPEGNVSEVITWLWCGVTSACRADGVDFGMTLDDFADRIDLKEVNEITAQLAADTSDAAVSSEKKTGAGSRGSSSASGSPSAASASGTPTSAA